MHPSLSVIFFTTLSGAGYGLLALTGILAPLGAVPQDRRFGLAALAVALALIAAGLLSSLFHLGRPERAWRAFSQWRSSWLSREGVAAVITFVPALAFAGVWIFGGAVSAILGFLAAAGAITTVVCTGMIYRSLKPIPRWHNRWVVPNYVALAGMTGSAWLLLLARLDQVQPLLPLLALAATAAAAILKAAYWRSIDAPAPSPTAGSATGLGRLGTVRLFEAPHTSDNYLLKEMGFRIARKHAAKLRRIVLISGFVAPALLFCIALVTSGALAALPALVAAALMMLGVFVERWLFFAEAQHVVTLYYGGSPA
ncbi:MAG: dimethyl sulfoxide reductase anchor subunit [Proteobacteria bacterium]|nr:dimethyl sulfoxide reductase anchor subunit [Pseudomonadota bacterium]